MANRQFNIRTAKWPDDAQALRLVRELVFIQEQKVPRELEWDGEDSVSHHLLATDSLNRPIGTARLLPSGQIGRMAVVKAWRGRGVGSALLKQLIALCDCGHPPFLNAQVHASAFYERLGFRQTGTVFVEAGIDHIRMEYRPE